MTDKTKAIPNGWVAPFYNSNGDRAPDFDIHVGRSDERGLICIDTDVLMVDVNQARALVAALTLAINEYEARE